MYYVYVYIPGEDIDKDVFLMHYWGKQVDTSTESSEAPLFQPAHASSTSKKAAHYR